MKNPIRALNAVTAPQGVAAGSYTVREITLGLAGVLEMIDSPLITGKKPQYIAGWRKTLFAVTHSTEVSESLLARSPEAYEVAARNWADTVPLRISNQMILDCQAAAKRVDDINDTGDDDDDDESDAVKNALAGTATAG